MDQKNRREVHNWRYEEENNEGPSSWKKSFQHCGGKVQSPVNLDTSRSVYENMTELDLTGYKITDVSLRLKKSDHTVKVVYSGSPIIISGGGLPSNYTLQHFHFHWGSDSCVGSEHLLDGLQFPMEIHLVHRRSELTEDQLSDNLNGLAVLGFFFELSDTDNRKLDVLLQHFNGCVELPDKGIEIKTFPLADLLPVPDEGGYRYFRYDGSLTTPPCNENVIWTVFTERIKISEDQLKLFRSIKDNHKPMMNNFRQPIELTSDRKLYVNQKSMLRKCHQKVVPRSSAVPPTCPRFLFYLFIFLFVLIIK
ncbi:Carbonic anhydrase 7 [Bulinus truncatus]|nr:Carbonic anhydrase 7 [Bulinus truncatus]